MSRSQTVKALATQAGFDLCGIARADEAPPMLKSRLKEWIDQGRHADMAWMERRFEERIDPRKVLPGALSVICLALVYNTDHPYSTDVFPLPNDAAEEAAGPRERGWISRYAWGEDYHITVGRKLKTLEACLRQEFGPHENYRSYCDTGPVSEKAWAAAAGVGWQGKNTNLINRRVGSWFFLAEILSTLDLEPDPPAADHCGTCTRCLQACPTQAFPRAYELDASRCISYLTIEKRGELPEDLKAGLGPQVYGCDICQDVCPWNRRRVLGHEPAFEPRPGLLMPDLNELATLEPAQFAQRFRDSAMRRTRAEGLRRNALLAGGQAPEPLNLEGD